ncbi:protein ENHANCED PSEUDOMONAS SUSCEPTIBILITY 1-like [Vicia villosa]|uniref:protein ENHANCED PSEUDOMONAS SUSCEPTIBILITY 1-like n=1 Tax=Vicia villosa TaxID=3911 RepID=UPI00273CDF15|nr:protein ENHANCED PSEUDOMONAS SUSCEPTIBILITY 1-like [Vicia villosa]
MDDSIKVISTSTIQAPNGNSTDFQKLDLTPWDLQFLPIETNQKGLIFHHQPNIDPSLLKNQIHHLKQTLSSTLSFFPPLAGRLVITQHQSEEENNNPSSSSSCHIICNNVGALFVHATAQNVTVSDILQPENYIVPPIVYSFFPLNGVKNCESTSHPILAVQVTDLLDGLFIGITINHAVIDGKSFWHFVNSWSQISRGDSLNKLPSLKRWFPNDIHQLPIRFPFTTDQLTETSNPNNLAERVFHFTKEKISELKSKANVETETENITISSLQAVLSHVLRSVVRCERLDPQQEVLFFLLIGVRAKMIPPLEDEYFGNAILVCAFTMKAEEILDSGIGKVALKMNKSISLYSDNEKIKNSYERWLKKPKFLTGGEVARRYYYLTTTNSPRFDVYGNDFGWGKPVGVRNGGANKDNGKISVFAGADEGSMDIIVCLPCKVLEDMGNDTEFLSY